MNENNNVVLPPIMKECNVCKQVKKLELFKKDKRRNDGYGSSCKECIKINGLEYYHRTKEARRDKINENRRKSYVNNKEKENISSKKWKDNNKEYIKEYNLNYNIINKEENINRQKRWRKNNKEKI